MKRLTMALLALTALTAGAVTVAPQATDEALINPDMGWCFYKYSNRLWAYGINTPTEDTLDWFPGCSTAYLRVLWNDIEPEEGQFRWDLFDSLAQNWIAKGKKIAIRIICCNQTETATPQFVRDAGAKGFWFEYKTDTSPTGKLPPRWEPVYDDPVFLAKLTNFIKAFARRYDGNPGVAFVDVGSYGIYGECHHHNTTQQHMARDEFVRLAKIHLHLWKDNLPNTYVVVSDDLGGSWNAAKDEPLMRYCREIGVGFRDDSIFCFPAPGTHPKCPFKYWSHDGWARNFAPKFPVVVETGHVPYLKEGPKCKGKWDDEAHVRCVEAYQCSYLSIHDFPDVFLERNRAVIDRINRKLGYRFELREVTYPDTVKQNGPFEITSRWVNVGVAPRTKDTALTWSLVNEDGTVAWCVTDNAFDFRSLEPKLDGVEKPLAVKTPCRFGFAKRIPQPDNCVVWAREVGRRFPETMSYLQPGTYVLAVSVGKPDGTPEIALPLRASIGTTRRYAVGKVTVLAAGKFPDVSRPSETF